MSKAAARHNVISFPDVLPGRLILVKLASAPPTEEGEQRTTAAVEDMTALACANARVHVSKTFLCLGMGFLSRVLV